jgi:hypothetical protein
MASRSPAPAARLVAAAPAAAVTTRRSRSLEKRWPELRYRVLLPLCRRSRALGRTYAAFVGALEARMRPDQRRVATTRISAWLGLSRASAAGIYQRTLVSEAREEADSAFLMGRPESLAVALLPIAGEPYQAGPVVYAALHLGSPILTFLELRRRHAVAAHMMMRELDGRDPMPDAKRRFGEAKNAWAERVAGVPFLGTDPPSLFAARERLLAGEAVYAAVDVPAERETRAQEIQLCGETIAVAGGVLRIARLTGAAVQLVYGLSLPSGLEVHYSRPIPPAEEDRLAAGIAEQMAVALGRFPCEWWLWPHVAPAASLRRCEAAQG